MNEADFGDKVLETGIRVRVICNDDVVPGEIWEFVGKLGTVRDHTATAYLVDMDGDDGLVPEIFFPDEVEELMGTEGEDAHSPDQPN